jgi:hypothetical protein
MSLNSEKDMRNEVGMTLYYSPSGKKNLGFKTSLFSKWKLRQRRKHTDDLAGLRGW